MAQTAPSGLKHFEYGTMSVCECFKHEQCSTEMGGYYSDAIRTVVGEKCHSTVWNVADAVSFSGG